MRAECWHDAEVFRKTVCGNLMEVKRMDAALPDVEIVFISDLDVNELWKRISKIMDGHVMAETVQPIENYTGARNYELKNQIKDLL